MPDERTSWKIRVQGYGTFDFFGTEGEAEDMRSHKARWERSSAIKWRSDLARESDRITAQMADTFDAGGGVPAALLRKRARALAVERSAMAQ